MPFNANLARAQEKFGAIPDYSRKSLADRFLEEIQKESDKDLRKKQRLVDAYRNRHLPEGFSQEIYWDKTNPQKPLIERLIVSKETNDRQKDLIKRITKRRSTKRKVIPPVVTPQHSEEDLEWFCLRDRVHADLMRRRAEEYDAAHRPLIDRIEKSPQPSTSQLPDPLPLEIKDTPDFHLRKTKYIARIKEFKPMCSAVITRLNPLFEIINQLESNNQEIGVEPGALEHIWEQSRLLDLWNHKFDEWSEPKWKRNYHLGRTDFRRFRGACKVIGRISFENLQSRLPEVVEALKKDLKFPIPED